ncbi:transcription factor 20 isoform X5 [Lacerta agilis]|uniref:transcription factor 20 isoform X5 n=1 Tax=Lacerta agilis TaxID=80427 RepID=UPI001419FF42|nr:transcription factor 20 isoform X5 [Lacerta agilis]
MDLLLSLPSLLTAVWNNPMLLGIFLAIFILAFDYMKRRKRWSHYPPGPVSLPFVGTILQIDFHNPHVSFTQLSKKYGNIYSLQNFWTNVVVLNGFKAVKEALVNKSEDFADRPFFPVYRQLGYGEVNQGLVMAQYSQAWKDQRRFTLSILRDFGMGKKSLEQLVTEEAGYLCSVFSSKEGQSFDPHYLINNAISNVICFLTFGNRFDYEDQKFQNLLHFLEQSMKEEAGLLPQVLNSLPFLMHIPGMTQKAFPHQKKLMDYLGELVNEHKETWYPSSKRDITEAFLEEIEKRKGENSSFNYQNLPLMIGDLFSAGTETTTTTLRWGLLYMILYPDIQSKVQEEIDAVIGRNRPATIEDQANMPYTRAVIHETQRFGDIVPAGIPHKAYRDTGVEGFFIPKGTTILTNLSSVLKDEAMWEKPHQFWPEHFLDANGQFVKREAFMPFSAGRRICLGEQLARMELFLFFTSLLQHFTFHIAEDHPRPREDGCFAFTLVPHPYHIKIVSR